MIDIKDLDKAEVLAGLYNCSRPQGNGFLNSRSGTEMSRDQAARYLTQKQNFDYLNGRVMKVNLSGDSFDPRLYNRDNGTDAAERIVNAIRNKSAAKPSGAHNKM